MRYDTDFRYSVLCELMDASERTIYNYLTKPMPDDITEIQYEDLYIKMIKDIHKKHVKKLERELKSKN